MPCSPEQIASNRKNAEKSTGPRTLEGKARSRANSLKHGLTGEAVVIPAEDQPESEFRANAFELEFQPTTIAGRFLIRRAARLSVRLDRSVDQEFAAVAQNVRNAPSAFDEARRLEVVRLMKGLVEDPADSVRQLRLMPEGIDALTSEILQVRANLKGTGDREWTGAQGQRLEQLMGIPRVSDSRARLAILLSASYGYFLHLKPEEGGGPLNPDRKAWAKNQVADWIDRELASLRELRGHLDLDAIALDRSESGARALFDPSRPAELARKYEAATERDFFRTLKEYRLVEAEVPEVVSLDATQETETVPGELASFFPHPRRAMPASGVPHPSSVERVAQAPRRSEEGAIDSRIAIPA